MLMIYGQTPFMAKDVPFDRLERDRQWNWASNNRVNNTPAYQYIGKGEESISLSGILMPEYTAGALSLENFRKMADQGMPFLLMTGYGQVYGYYFLDSIKETHSEYEGSGIAQKIEFSLSLRKADDEVSFGSIASFLF